MSSAAVRIEAGTRLIYYGDAAQAMAARYSVVEVHDLHIWEITSGSPAL